jgi:hypothetical protein
MMGRSFIVAVLALAANQVLAQPKGTLCPCNQPNYCTGVPGQGPLPLPPRKSHA